MRRAWVAIRNALHYRLDAFTSGLERNGFTVSFGTVRPSDGDIFVTWNRYGHNDSTARLFEARGLPAIVAENAAWGNDFAGQHWYSLALGVHNTAGKFPVGGPERWDSLGVELAEWRTEGETVILPQRGIGPPGVAMPPRWTGNVQRETGGRIRPHPGVKPCKPLKDDLAHAGKVVTWGSGAAIKALLWGIPVRSDMPDWIGAQNNTDQDRLRMFRELAWAQWTQPEIASGEAFARLLA